MGNFLKAGLLWLFIAAVTHAHLCDNVFEQARDNLVVKVDVRDGQLRIGREASFRVYLLNTMDRDIAEIALEIDSPQFDAEIQPSPEWRNYPGLRTTNPSPRWRLRGARDDPAKKEYFTVTLRRKAGVADGSYRIGLNVVSRRQNISFRSLDLAAAADLCPMPFNNAIVVDGSATPEEWRESFLCANFHVYARDGRYTGNLPAADQTRVRVAHDDRYLYFLVSFHGGDAGRTDRFAIHVAPSSDDVPVSLEIDRYSGMVTGPDAVAAGSMFRANPDENILEGRIAREALGLRRAAHFHMNFTRTIGQNDGRTVTYWRGNELSIQQPIVYGQFQFAQQ